MSPYRTAIFHLAAIILVSCPVFLAAEEIPDVSRRPSALIISPLVGWARNEVFQTGQIDQSLEYGLFAMYRNPRFMINNTTTFTDINQSDTWGNITVANLYGNPKASLTWQIGGQYVWRNVQGNPDVTVKEPQVNAGVLWRIPSMNLTLNPYVGYGQSRIRTVRTVMVGPPPFTQLEIKNTDRSDIMHCGIFTHWRWRMLQVNANYYLSNDLDHNTCNHTLRVFGGAMFSEHVGLMTRFEYAEQNNVEDISLLAGPVFMF